MSEKETARDILCLSQIVPLIESKTRTCTRSKSSNSPMGSLPPPSTPSSSPDTAASDLVWEWGFKVKGLGCVVDCFGCIVEGLGFGVEG